LPWAVDTVPTTGPLATPLGLALDAAGDLFVVDRPSTLLRVDADGSTHVVATGLANPYGLALDMTGNLIVAETGTHTIDRITPTGMRTSLAGTGVGGYADGVAAHAQFSGPTGVAVDRDNNVYVADTGNNRLRKIAPDGTVTTVAGSGVAGYVNGPAQAAQFSGPSGVTVGRDGTIYIADTGNGALRRLDTQGMVSTVGDRGVLMTPDQLTTDTGGTIFVTDRTGNRIVAISAGGDVVIIAGQSSPLVSSVVAPGKNATFDAPVGIAIDGTQHIYVSDSGNHRIRIIMQCKTLTCSS
jgi:sugar lactone lactonase YvrE